MIRSRTKRRLRYFALRWGWGDYLAAILIGSALLGMAYHFPTFIENALR